MTLNKIIDNIGFKKITGWIQLYAQKLEDEGKNEIIILNIDREDLENQIPNTLELGSIEYANWEALRTYISDEDVNEEIEESKAFIYEIKQEIEEDGDDFDDYDFTIHRVLLLCEKQYVHSITLYTKVQISTCYSLKAGPLIAGKYLINF